MTRVRPATPADRDPIDALHEAAIRAFGPEAYDDDQVEAWAGSDDDGGADPAESDGPGGASESDDADGGLPIEDTDHHVLAAERDGEVAGFGHLDLPENEVRAVYVHPDHADRGVGSALLAGLEGFARGRGLDELRLLSSLNAVGFYERAGYDRVRETTHETSAGVELPVVEVRKPLRPASRI